jgi:hypothetical protein
LTSIERAAAYLKKLGPKAVLAIVPLAVAVPAVASTVTFTNTAGVISATGISGGMTSSSFGGAALPGSVIQGYRVSGGAAFNFSSGFVYSLIFSPSGGGSGVFPSSAIGGAWNFTLTSTVPQFVNWEVDYVIDSILTTATTGSGTITGAPTNVNDAGLLSVDSGGTLTSWSDQIRLTWIGANFGTLTLNVTSLDVSGQGAAAVPEPSTLLMMFPLAGGWLLYRRRRKA